ncbi:MAG TPA: chorismate synthase [bacterium]|nr:chorismate synthase [bacterium]HOL48836.1 chorismate synthase [bacterium]HPQ19898.1 chorismate synthase [bacterium]
MRFLTAGESHGKELVLIIDGFPSNVKISEEKINYHLARRQMGYGRGERMNIETDKAEIISGIRFGKTTGAPITIKIKNKDYENWLEQMSVFKDNSNKFKKLLLPRPGHSDLCGFIKYQLDDIRNVLERSSARETATRVAAGALCRIFLDYFNIDIVSHTISIGEIKIKNRYNYFEIKKIQDDNILRCIEKEVEKKMLDLIAKIRNKGDTIGGVFEVIIHNIFIGLGSYVHFDARLDAKLAAAIMSIPGIKGVEIGAGFDGTKLSGSQFHDEFDFLKDRIIRKTNNAGGIEGGISNGEDIIIHGAIKPIPTLINSLQSVNLKTYKKEKAIVERSDVCVVPAAGVVAEAMAAIVISNEILNFFGEGSIEQILKRYKEYKKYLKKKKVI